MDLDLFLEPNLHIVLGKGGVGKTTVAGALALMAAGAGRDTLICETEGKSGLGSIFGKGELKFQEDSFSEHIWARTIWPDDALIEYLSDHGMTRFSRLLMRTNVLEYVATAIPGIKDVLVLGKIKQIVKRSRSEERRYDLVVVDAPAAGHAITFLTSAVGIANAVRVGPLRDQALDVIDLLEAESTVVHLVTIPEETPVNEAAETAHALQERMDCKMGVVFVNGCYPRPLDPIAAEEIEEIAARLGIPVDSELALSIAAANQFMYERYELQQIQRNRLAAMLDMTQIELPFIFNADFGRTELDLLARAMATSIQSTGSPAKV